MYKSVLSGDICTARGDPCNSTLTLTFLLDPNDPSSKLLHITAADTSSTATAAASISSFTTYTASTSITLPLPLVLLLLQS